MKRLSILFWLAGASPLCGQHFPVWADSIRMVYHIPGLSYAVVSAEKVLALEALGYKKNNSTLIAGLEDRYRIGSNTKTVTSYLAARKDLDRAYILFANIQSDDAEKGLNLLLDQLKKKYNP